MTLNGVEGSQDKNVATKCQKRIPGLHVVVYVYQD